MKKLDELRSEDFRAIAAGDPELLQKQWCKTLRQLRDANDETKYRKFLALTADLSDGAVRHWLSNRLKELSEETIRRLHRINRLLERAPPRSLEEDLAQKARTRKNPGLAQKPHGPKRLALLTYATVVSEAYYLGVIKAVEREATAHNFALSTHHLSIPIDARAVEMIAATFRLDGCIFLRITPTSPILDSLKKDGQPIPAVLVHSERQSYPPPVLTNVVPDHNKLTEEFRPWLRNHLSRRRNQPSKKVVLVAMPNETPQLEFAPLKGIHPSIRNDRKRALRELLSGCRVEAVDNLEDYGFHNAISVWETHPDADLYICLSDQLAVGLKQLLIASGDRRGWRKRIVGFDNTPLAKAEQIPSFSQDLETVGQLAVRRLSRFFSSNASSQWPKFKESKIDVRFVAR